MGLSKDVKSRSYHCIEDLEYPEFTPKECMDTGTLGSGSRRES